VVEQKAQVRVLFDEQSALVHFHTLELGLESELEKVQKLFCEVGQHRPYRLDRSLLDMPKTASTPESLVSGVYERAITPRTPLSPQRPSKTAYAAHVEFRNDWDGR
jgi:hypothetical protein